METGEGLGGGGGMGGQLGDAGEFGDTLGRLYARSMPAENTFSLAEDRTTTRTVGSSAIQSKAAPYSRQNLAQAHVRR